MLSKISKYELDRGENERIFIDVLHPIAGVDEDAYLAFPNLFVRSAKEGFIGKGRTEEEALNNCLSLIKGKAVHEFIEDMEEDEENT